ncbi:SCP-like protein, partial [Ancylostoma duodenale]
SLVAKGEAEDKKGKHTPKAAKMYKLQYSCDLEKLAVSHAQNCVSEHSDDTTREGAGENLYSISIPDADRLKTAEKACRTWFGELWQVGVDARNVFSRKLQQRAKKIGAKIGHYTQMVWGATEHIGCGIHNCKDQTLVVCNYRTAGNTINQKIYDVGTPCSECPETHECTEEKLCARKQNLEENPVPDS